MADFIHYLNICTQVIWFRVCSSLQCSNYGGRRGPDPLVLRQAPLDATKMGLDDPLNPLRPNEACKYALDCTISCSM